MRVPAALLALVLAVGCTSHSPSRTTSPSPSGTRGPSASSTPSARPAVTLVDSAFVDRGSFRTPSGNILCALEERFAGCSVVVHDWSAPPDEEGCTADDEAGTVRLNGSKVSVATDCYTLAEKDAAVLNYGSGVELDGVRCVSEESGVTCLDTTTRKGFTVSRRALRTTPVESALTRGPATAGDGTVPAGFEAAFVTPTRNLNCYFAAALVSCLVGEHDWETEPYDPKAEGGPCDFDESPTVELRAGERGRAITDCRSDANPGQRPLPYGASLQVGAIRCTSARTGLTCTSGEHGFEVSRATFRGY